MLILGILITILILGIVAFRINEIAGIFLTTTGVVLLVMSAATIPIERMATLAGIEQFKATQKTYEVARNKNVDLEKAAIQLDVAEQNRWLAGKKYWNATVFDIWIHDEIETLSPIE